jgi:hypothetical protein
VAEQQNSRKQASDAEWQSSRTAESKQAMQSDLERYKATQGDAEHKDSQAMQSDAKQENRTEQDANEIERYIEMKSGTTGADQFRAKQRGRRIKHRLLWIFAQATIQYAEGGPCEDSRYEIEAYGHRS